MDGTLVRKDYVEHVWLDAIPAIYARENDMDTEGARRYILEEYMKVGEHAVEWYDIKYWLKKFNLECNWRELLEGHVNMLQFYPEVHGVIDRLGRNHKLIIISNAAGEFIEVERRALKLDEKFDRIFSAVTDFGSTKKNPEVYTAICDALGVDKDNIVHVGDSLEFDYFAPTEAGIRAFYLDRDGGGGEGGAADGSTVKDLEEFEKRLYNDH